MTIGKRGTPEDLRSEVERSLREQEQAKRLKIKPHTALVRLNIAPELIPKESTNPERLAELVHKEFGSVFDPSEITKLVPEALRGNLAVSDYFRIATEGDKLVKFKGGALRLPNIDRVSPIESFGFGEQNLIARVYGSTDEALYLCRRLCLLVWQAGGSDRRWDDLEDGVALTTFRTSTVVELGIPLMRLMAPQVLAFFQKEVAGNDGFGSHMGRFASGSHDNLRIVSYCQSIDFRVSVFDEVSGEAEDCAVEFLLHTRGDANRSRVKFETELPSSKHNEFVTRLVEATLAGG